MSAAAWVNSTPCGSGRWGRARGRQEHGVTHQTKQYKRGRGAGSELSDLGAQMRSSPVQLAGVGCLRSGARQPPNAARLPPARRQVSAAAWVNSTPCGSGRWGRARGRQEHGVTHQTKQYKRGRGAGSELSDLGAQMRSSPVQLAGVGCLRSGARQPPNAARLPPARRQVSAAACNNNTPCGSGRWASTGAS